LNFAQIVNSVNARSVSDDPDVWRGLFNGSDRRFGLVLTLTVCQDSAACYSQHDGRRRQATRPNIK
jgi:hypothetical protein